MNCYVYVSSFILKPVDSFHNLTKVVNKYKIWISYYALYIPISWVATIRVMNTTMIMLRITVFLGFVHHPVL
jgi:hypothetical protein